MIYLITGVSGSGKTTVGKKVANRLNCPYHEGDDYHSEQGLELLNEGINLSEKDRKDWIYALRSVVDMEIAMQKNAVITATLLKEKQRTAIIANRPQIKLIYLKADINTAKERLRHKKNHIKLLQYQFDNLEEPVNAMVIGVEKSPDEIVNQILI